jgi:hypothetical protein
MSPYSILAQIMSAVMMVVIAFSCVCYVLATDPGLMYVFHHTYAYFYLIFNFNFHRTTPSTCDMPGCDNDPILCPNTQICPPEPSKLFGLFEIICVSIFTIDYVIRVATVSFIPSRYNLLH